MPNGLSEATVDAPSSDAVPQCYITLARPFHPVKTLVKATSKSTYFTVCYNRFAGRGYKPIKDDTRDVITRNMSQYGVNRGPRYGLRTT